ncbi:MAG: undecaprenyldiphospho-muramoylpentapeptide beta-N-acetylglucosaminyltransferase [Limnohabitans sp.]|nr:undecaprenyldiphospho-muramoylpentapeptide beta-N-acetylglucosaminyltransferase [Limnohabitans sp.]
MKTKIALVIAGGTGGHIFPCMAVAQTLRDRGWRVHWLGGAEPSMESQRVPLAGFVFHAVQFGGLRGKGVLTWLKLPARMLRAFQQSRHIIRQVNPDVVMGFGGYITFPAGVMAVLQGKPLIVHEQNALAGLANRWLSLITQKVFTSFPHVLKRGQWIGNPLRDEFLKQDAPSIRFQHRQGPLQVLVMGGSLGAKALNDIVPQAIGLIDPSRRPLVTHQSGEKQIQALEASYTQAGVIATLTPFIEDAAAAMAKADLIICRAGASTVTEIAAIGGVAIFVPFPHAVDDHQTANANFLVNQGAAWLAPQHSLDARTLAAQIQNLDRTILLEVAQRAYDLRKVSAANDMVAACEELVA